MDFYAWMEVFLRGEWWTFDPRNGERRVGRVLIGRGRDAVDVAMVSTFGTVELESMVVWGRRGRQRIVLPPGAALR
jgi:transglutaminase-like putative cysteine protease